MAHILDLPFLAGLFKCFWNVFGRTFADMVVKTVVIWDKRVDPLTQEEWRLQRGTPMTVGPELECLRRPDDTPQESVDAQRVVLCDGPIHAEEIGSRSHLIGGVNRIERHKSIQGMCEISKVAHDQLS